MQYKNRDFNPKEHDRFKAISVNQPYADMIRAGDKTIELRSRDTQYRGDLIVCDTFNKTTNSYGSTLVRVELNRTKRVRDLTEAEIANTKASPEVLKRYRDGYAYFFRDPRPMVEFPVIGQLGIWNLVYTKGTLMEYPKDAVDIPKRRPIYKRVRAMLWIIYFVVGFICWAALYLGIKGLIN